MKYCYIIMFVQNNKYETRVWHYQPCFLSIFQAWLRMMIGTSQYNTFLSIKYFWLGVPPADENMTIPLTDCMSYRPSAVKIIVARRDGDAESPATRFSTFFMAPASQHPRGYYLRAFFYFVSYSSSSSLFFLYSPFKLPSVVSITCVNPWRPPADVYSMKIHRKRFL